MAITASRNSGAGSGNAPQRRARQQPRARATRLAILTAAAEHFARDGYHATSLDRVLADSGGTKGALYFHFSSKEDLARAVIGEMVRRWQDLRAQVDARGLDPLRTLLALVDVVISRLIDSPIARGGTRLINELGQRSPEATGHYGSGEQDALIQLEKASQQGLLREGIDPALAARQIVAVLAGHRQISDTQRNREDLWWRMDEAWTLLLPSIATDEWLERWRASSWATRPRPPGDDQGGAPTAETAPAAGGAGGRGDSGAV